MGEHKTEVTLKRMGRVRVKCGATLTLFVCRAGTSRRTILSNLVSLVG